MKQLAALEAHVLSGKMTEGDFKNIMQSVRASAANLAAGASQVAGMAATRGTVGRGGVVLSNPGLGMPCTDWDALPAGQALIGNAGYEWIHMDTVPLKVHVEDIEGHANRQFYAASAYWFWVKRQRWELDTLLVFRHMLDRDTVAVDFGSWIGPTVLYAAAFAGEVWGLEADPVAYGEMVRNVAANAGGSNNVTTDNIHLRHICIDSVPGVRTFGSLTGQGDSMSSLLWQKGTHAKGDMAKHASPEYAKHQWHVPCVDLPSLIHRQGIYPQAPPAPHAVPRPGGDPAAAARVTALLEGEQGGLETCRPHGWAPSKLFVKIDIEGGEMLIMPGLAEWLVGARATVLLSVHVQHVQNHREGGYDVSGQRGVVEAVRRFPYVYTSEASGREGMSTTPMDTAALTPETLCRDCEYLLTHSPMPDAMVRDIEALNALHAKHKAEDEAARAQADGQRQ